MTIARGAGHRHESPRDRVAAIRRELRSSLSSRRNRRAATISASPSPLCVCLPPLFGPLPSLSLTSVSLSPPLPLWTTVRAVSAFCIAQSPGTENAGCPCARVFSAVNRSIGGSAGPCFLAVVGRARPCDWTRDADPDVRQRRRARN